MIVSVFAALALIVLLGSLLIYIIPGLQVDSIRQNLNKLVLYIFLPALNFNVIYNAQIGHEFWQLPILAFLGLLLSVGIGVVVYHYIPVSKHSKGALILGCAFSNVTYFGIAVLQGLFPQHSIEVTKVAVLFEITLAPLNLVFGSALAAYYGKKEMFSLHRSLIEIIKLPLLWSTFIALALNLLKCPVPSFIMQSTGILSQAVSGLMILSLGMALKYPVLFKAFREIHYLMPVLVIKLIISPFIMFFGVKFLGVSNPYFQAAIIEAAMPSQLITLAVADRYSLDTEILAVAISLDTVASFFTIPIIHAILNYL